MAAFPSYPKLRFDGYGEPRESAVDRTQMESGPPKQLKVKSRVLVQRPVLYDLDSLADYNSFMTWFQTTVNYGADWFDWTDPRDSTLKAARIAEGKLDARAKNNALSRWTVGFILETWSA